eukprot:131668_1
MNIYTLDELYDLIEENIITHYCPNNEKHWDCFFKGFDWCWCYKKHVNYINTSSIPLPVSKWLGPIVMDIIRTKICPPVTLEMLCRKGNTIYNELGHNVGQKYANKRKVYGARIYQAQVYRSVPQINDGPAQHTYKLQYFILDGLSENQKQIIKYLVKRRKDSRERSQKGTKKSKMKRRKWYAKGERVTVEEAYSTGVLWR